MIAPRTGIPAARTDDPSSRASAGTLWTAPAAEPRTAGLYLHVPFCARMCTYCDFDTSDRELPLLAPYAAALATEVARAPVWPLHSVFFGGGTPSLLTPDQLGAVLAAVRARFPLAATAEVTVECNPNNVREARLAGYRAAGVNRLSLGVQSFDDAVLRALGRQHTAARVRQAVATARAVGFDDLSLDLMYGLPGQTLADWTETVEAALALRPEHLSAYLLTLEDWTPLGQQVASGAVVLPDDDTVAEQYDYLRQRLTLAGYDRYEISNWALTGRASRHNIGYWRLEPYLGLGAGGVSGQPGLRRKNTPRVGEYLAAIRERRPVPTEDEPLDAATMRREALMLGLRLRGGIDPAAFAARFGVALHDVCGPALAELAGAGFLEWHAGCVRLTDRALLVSNEVLLRLVEDWAR